MAPEREENGFTHTSEGIAGSVGSEDISVLKAKPRWVAPSQGALPVPCHLAVVALRANFPDENLMRQPVRTAALSRKCNERREIGDPELWLLVCGAVGTVAMFDPSGTAKKFAEHGILPQSGEQWVFEYEMDSQALAETEKAEEETQERVMDGESLR